MSEPTGPLQEAVEKLGEHFDSVVIICTRHEATEGGTSIEVAGAGNVYARIGSVRDWLLKKDEETRVLARPG